MAVTPLKPFRLKPFFSPRPWGRNDLSPWYTAAETGAHAEPIGEAWLTGPQAVAADGEFAGKTLAEVAKAAPESLLGEWKGEGEFPLLIKLLFPDDKLSVQVHPDDEAAQKIGQARGKTECWYALEAEPGAAVSCGLKHGVTADALRASVANNSMEDLLEQIVLKKGDMVFVDAGTVHAIGPGLTLLETQQTSDTTYRMYDYGRPRELHLEQGIGVMRTETSAGLVQPTPLEREDDVAAVRLIRQKYFTVDRFDLAAGEEALLSDAVGRPHCVVAVEGEGVLTTSAGDVLPLKRGVAVVVPAAEGEYTVLSEAGASLIRSMP